MEVRLLGPLEVIQDGGQQVVVPGGRQRTLLALLALDPGRVFTADRLIDDLWTQASPLAPANALQLVVSKLRRALPEAVVATRPPGYVLLLPIDNVDAGRFEHLVGDGREASRSGRPAAAIDRFDEALSLWRGDPLGEFGAAPTAGAAAVRLRELWAATVEERFDALLAIGRSADLVPDLEAAISTAPFRERLRAQLMLALYRSGRQADALGAFREARRVLAEELGLEPSGELRGLEAAILGQDPSLDHPANSALLIRPGPPARTPTNLRPSLASFVGRRGDLAGIGALLERHRLVTLVGAGGCGKTRLATEFANDYLTEFPDGVWFAALDRLTDGHAVVEAVAEAVGLSTADTTGQPVPAGSTMPERLRTMLADRVALVVLDNCEHVIEYAARLAVDLLASAPRLRLLATSRERLRVPGEMVWRVPPLSTDEAVMLFTQRAHAVTSNDDPRTGDRGVVAQLCERVDGMPLAIELLAARTSAFTVGQLAERLDDRFRLLTGGDRTALPRHQTLRAVTDWSYDLLFEGERKVFERLAVFTGGCTLEAAEEVAADHIITAPEVGGIVGRLADKSLVVADGSGRFRLLLTLAEYGRRRLEEHDGDGTVRDRHATYYARLAERSIADWRRPDGQTQLWWLATLGAELDNFRAALDWAITHDDARTAQLSAGNLGWYWWHAGRAVEGYRWLERALGCGGPTLPTVLAPALTWAAWLALQAGDIPAAASRVSAAVSTSQDAGDFTSLGMAWTVRFQLALLAGSPDLAATCLDRGQEADGSVDDPWHQGVAAMQRSLAADLRGQGAAALQEAVTALDVFRTVGDVCTLVPMLGEYSRMLESRGELEAAEAAAREGRDTSDAYGLRGYHATMSNRLGSLALLRGDARLSAHHFQAAIEMAHRLALLHAELAALEGLALALHERGDDAAAREREDAARALADRLGATSPPVRGA